MPTSFLEQFLDDFERVRGYRPSPEVTRDDRGAIHLRMPRFAEIVIGSSGGCRMPQISTYPEGDAYSPAVRLGWPDGRGAAARVACIFADFYETKADGEKPPYFLFTPAQWLTKDADFRAGRLHMEPRKPGRAAPRSDTRNVSPSRNSHGDRDEAKGKLSAIIKTVAQRQHVQEKLHFLRQDEKELQRPDFVWNSLVESFSSMGNSRGYYGLFVNSDLHKKITFDVLSQVPVEDRLELLDKTLRAASVRMPLQKAEWLVSNFGKIVALGGQVAAKEQLLQQAGRTGKLAFLETFDGIGPKYARNIFMNVYHPEFRDCIAVDERIKSVSEGLGVSFGNYEDEERFYLDVAKDSGLNGWELDRILYWFKDEVLSLLSPANTQGHGCQSQHKREHPTA